MRLAIVYNVLLKHFAEKMEQVGSEESSQIHLISRLLSRAHILGEGHLNQMI